MNNRIFFLARPDTFLMLSPITIFLSSSCRLDDKFSKEESNVYSQTPSRAWPKPAPRQSHPEANAAAEIDVSRTCWTKTTIVAEDEIKRFSSVSSSSSSVSEEEEEKKEDHHSIMR